MHKFKRFNSLNDNENVVLVMSSEDSLLLLTLGKFIYRSYNNAMKRVVLVLVPIKWKRHIADIWFLGASKLVVFHGCMPIAVYFTFTCVV